MASLVLATSGCAARRPGPTPGIGGGSAPAATTEKSRAEKVGKVVLIVATVAVIAVALLVVAAMDAAGPD